MKKRDLVLVGGGGHGRSVIDVAESLGYRITILDCPEYLGKTVSGYEVTGTDEDIPRYAGKALFIISVGHILSCEIRRRLHDRISACGGELTTLIAPTAYVSHRAELGEGTVVMHHAVVNAGASVGKCCIINTHATVEHDVRIGDFCHISTGTVINGEARIGAGTFIGSRSVVNNGLAVAGGSVIASASLVRGNIVRCGVYAGIPAVYKKSVL